MKKYYSMGKQLSIHWSNACPLVYSLIIIIIIILTIWCEVCETACQTWKFIGDWSQRDAEESSDWNANAKLYKFNFTAICREGTNFVVEM